MLQTLISTTFIAHMSPDPVHLSALALASSLYNVMGYSLVAGLASAMETLCGQVGGGSGGLEGRREGRWRGVKEGVPGLEQG